MPRMYASAMPVGTARHALAQGIAVTHNQLCESMLCAGRAPARGTQGGDYVAAALQPADAAISLHLWGTTMDQRVRESLERHLPLLACPKCGADLALGDEELRCSRCREAFGVGD